MADNILYYGDNLDILRRYVEDESVDLIYLDPPFNSDQDYNVLFAEQDGTRSAAQIKAFEDTWRWDQASAREYHQIVEQGPDRVSKAMQAFRTMLGENDLLAYLAMIAPRFVELHRVLRPTGSIYLHCDPAASHYLKTLMDAVFGGRRFCNEIVWKRTHAHGSSRRFGPLHDVILFYSKGDEPVWTNPKGPHDPEYLAEHFRHVDEASGRRFQPISLTGAGVRRGESGKAWRGINPTSVGRHWALPGAVLETIGVVEGTVQQKLDALDAAGLIFWPEKRGGTPRLKWYADDLTGQALPDVWSDIPPISSHAAERLGYPTQKPEALLERIIRASSREGDILLDPFCGCGTAIAVAQRLKRRWIGIDITHLAINLIRHRLKDGFGEQVESSYCVEGEPTDLTGARALAAQDRFQFQCWALGLVGARKTEVKKGADRGIDGRLFFHDDNGKTKQVIFSVKSGKVSVKDVRDLRGVVEREEAALGLLITLEDATQPMRGEAAAAGFYLSPWTQKNHPRMQVLTVEQLLAGKRVDMPPVRHTNVTFKKAPKATGREKRSTKRKKSNGPSMFA